jgi:hypothetical protein
MKIRLIKHFDANNNEIPEDERDRVVGDREHITVPLTMIDSAGRDGTYALRDGHGRVCGVGDVQAELRRIGAAEDYKQRIGNAWKNRAQSGPVHASAGKVRDADPLAPPTLKAAFVGQCPSCGYSSAGHEAVSGLTPSQLAQRAYTERLSSAHKHVVSK